MNSTSQKQKLQLLYAWMMVVLALISILIIILDYAQVINIALFPYNLIDNGIWLIFVIDYFVRFLVAKNKKEFFQNNFFDLLSIIPVSGIFAFFRIGRLTRLVRLLRVVRLVGLTGRLKGFLKTNGLIYYLYISFALLMVSSCVYSVSEHTNLENAFWWSLTTATTVGYGDMTPKTGLGRIAAVILMLVGIGFVGMVTSSITSSFANQEQLDTKAEIEALHRENNQIIKELNEVKRLLKERQ